MHHAGKEEHNADGEEQSRINQNDPADPQQPPRIVAAKGAALCDITAYFEEVNESNITGDGSDPAPNKVGPEQVRKFGIRVNSAVAYGRNNVKEKKNSQQASNHGNDL
jgi:hypothetical protein